MTKPSPISSLMKRIETVPFLGSEARGALTVGLSGLSGALLTRLLFKGEPSLQAGAICACASIIVQVVARIFDAREGQKVMAFGILPAATVLVLSLVGTVAGYPVTIPLALVLSVQTVASTVLGLYGSKAVFEAI